MNDPHSHAPRLDWAGIFRTAVSPSLEAAGKTCDAMQSCIAASWGSRSLANPLGACAEPCFSRSGKYLPNPAFSSFSVVHE